MRKFFVTALAAVMATGCGVTVTNEFTTNPSLAGHTTVTTLDDQMIVKYRTANFSTKGVQLQYRMPGSVVLDSFQSPDGLTELQRVPAGTTMTTALSRYEEDSTVEAVMPNQVWHMCDVVPETPNDDRFAEQWHANTLQLLEAWKTSQGDGVTVAVIDTGVDASHPDLASRIAADGYDFVEKDKDPKDLNGHGTHVAGIIAAKLNNGIGIAGVAPKAKILPLRVLDEQGRGSTFNIVKAMTYAASHGARVINLSLGSGSANVLRRLYLKLYGNSITKKGVLLVAASGNEGGAVGLPADTAPFMAVGATNGLDKIASFSNFGKSVAVSAPGVDILSTMPTYPCYLSTHFPDKVSGAYGKLSGTSMATPMVAATAALLFSAHPDWTPAQVRAQIEKTALDLGTRGKDTYFGYGRIQPLLALGN